MKKGFVPILFIFTGLFLLFTVTGCTGNRKSTEEKLVENFTKTYFTIPTAEDSLNQQNESNIFQVFFTTDAYKYFASSRLASSRTYYSSGFKGKIENIEMSNLKIEKTDASDDKYHYYNVSCHLKNTSNSNETDANFKISLEKENNSWKIGMNNRIDDLYGWLRKMWEPNNN